MRINASEYGLGQNSVILALIIFIMMSLDWLSPQRGWRVDVNEGLNIS